MRQHALDYRRAGLTPPVYETTSRGPAAVADAGMIARHEYLARQRPAVPPGLSRAAAALELRRRRLELQRLASGH